MSLIPYVLAAGEGVPDFDGSVKASRGSTGGALTFIESRTDGGAPMHVHEREDEYFYVVEGTLEVVNAESRRAFQLGFSLRAAFFEPGSDETLEQLIQRADAVMYEEKRARKQARA